MPVKCQSCEKLRDKIKKQEDSLERKDTFIAEQREKVQEYIDELDKATNRIAELSTVECSVDLQPYYFKLDRVEALVKAGDAEGAHEAFLAELLNFRTMLNQIRRENDKTA